jgi:hypothetical protein
VTATIPTGARFAPLTPELLNAPGLTLAHVKVWSYVWDQTLGRPTWTLSYRQIAEATGLSRRSAVRAVAWLVGQGWLTRESRRSDSGDPDASLILCTFPTPGVVTPMSPPRDREDTRGSDTHVTRGRDTDGPYQESHLPGESLPGEHPHAATAAGSNDNDSGPVWFIGSKGTYHTLDSDDLDELQTAALLEANDPSRWLPILDHHLAALPDADASLYNNPGNDGPALSDWLTVHLRVLADALADYATTYNDLEAAA